MGNGNLFLPVKAEIRKKIKKQAGDYVHVILYKDDSVFEVPQEIIDCLKLEPALLKNSLRLQKGSRKFLQTGFTLPKKRKQKPTG